MKNQENMPNDREINRKRKNNHDFQIPRRFSSEMEENENDYLTLSLAFRPSKPRKLSPVQPPPPPPPPPTLPSPPPPLPPPPPSIPLVQSMVSQPPSPHQYFTPTQHFYTPPPPPPPPPPSTQPVSSCPALVYRHDAGPSRPTRPRRNPSQAPGEGKKQTIPTPYPWATDQRATVHSINHLLSREIFTIKGTVQCKRCEKQYEMEYDLREKFVEVGTFIAENKSTMHDRAPGVWMNPVLPTCQCCDHENSVKPIIAEKKKAINWLFLLLGQMLGCCTLEQLKYFCKHTKNHRTGAKDRVLYLTYLGLCKQLDPSGPFDR